jgi:hypothetical protein
VVVNGGAGPQGVIFANSTTSHLALTDSIATITIKPSAGTAGTGPQAGYALVWDTSQSVFRPQAVSTNPMNDSKFTPLITMDVGV